MKKMYCKIVFVALVVLSVVLCCVGCGNKDMWDTVYTYDRAIITLPNGEVIEGKVSKWSDYEDGDQLQITINGVVYLVHSSNCVLIAD